MTSPNVSVFVQDQSIYAEPNPQTIPLFVIATRANKLTPDGTSVAPGTEESNTIRVVTSQRELLINYGDPVFVTSSGEPIPGDETNEYALLTAHSFLGRGSRALIVRADVDLGQLVPSVIEPTEPPSDGTFWIDSDSVVGGVFVRQAGSFTPIIDSNSFFVFTNAPTASDGNDGDWGFDYSNSDGTLVYKNGGTWKVATNANLETDFGSGTNLHVSPTTPTVAQDGDFWYKTTSSGGGVNLQLTRFRAADGVFTTQTIIRDVSPPVPNEGTIWEDISNINTSGARPLFIGTGASFIPLQVFIQPEAPAGDPSFGTLWYDDTIEDFALYVEGTEIGFGNQWVPVTTTTVANPTNRQKVISASSPQFPQEGAIWVDISTPENVDNYPVIKKFIGGSFVDITSNVLIQPEDPIAFAVLNGTYWLNNGESITRNTIKRFNRAFTALTVEEQGGQFVVVEETGNPWEPAAGDQFGRKAQRDMVVEGLQSSFISIDELRSEVNFFQLIACPGYPELYDEMNTLNSDRNETAFAVADTPKFMVPSGIPEGREVSAIEWVTNANNVTSTGERGFASGPNSFAAFYYPWAISTNITGEDVFVPPSHMALRTIAFSDSVAAPWFPPAGFTRGRVDNASAVGHLDNNGEFRPLQLTKAQRDVIYEQNINPIAFIPNRGLVVFGQKTNQAIASALDRINVARLIAKMKFDLDRLLEPFLFEINDPVTRRSAQVVTERYLAGLKSLRAIFDFAVRCDESNNPPSVIDNGELFVDLAIKPSRAIEFIFVPITILGTGDDFPF